MVGHPSRTRCVLCDAAVSGRGRDAAAARLAGPLKRIVAKRAEESYYARGMTANKRAEARTADQDGSRLAVAEIGNNIFMDLSAS